MLATWVKTLYTGKFFEAHEKLSGTVWAFPKTVGMSRKQAKRKNGKRGLRFLFRIGIHDLCPLQVFNLINSCWV